MKKAGIVFAAVAVMVTLFGGAAVAEETKTSLGVKAWLSSWEDHDSLYGTDNYGSVLLIGPAVEAKFKNNVFLRGSLLFATSDYEYTYFDPPYDGKTIISNRTDLDLMAGYMFTKEFGAFVGYKFMTADFTDEWPIGTVTFTSDITIKGPGIGVLGNIPVSETAALYGSLGWIFLDIEAKSTSGTASNDMDGPSAEIGAVFNVSPQSVITVGYKYEKFSGTYSDGTSFDETFAGLTAGFNYTF